MDLKRECENQPVQGFYRGGSIYARRNTFSFLFLIFVFVCKSVNNLLKGLHHYRGMIIIIIIRNLKANKHGTA